MGIQIDVDYNNKDKAKAAGAFWDADLKTWYIPERKTISDFSGFLPENVSAIVKAPFIIAKSSKNCWRCGKETPLITIGARKSIILDYDEETETDIWRAYNDLLYFYYIQYLPKNVISLVTARFSFYRQTYSKTIKDSYWANNCIHCGILQGDFENHCEPSGPFLPIFPEDTKIELIDINVKHDFPIIGDYNEGNPEFVI